MACLSEFSGRSGLDINLSKSKLFVSPNIQGQVANSFSSACGIPLTCDLGVYLGVPIIHKKLGPSTYKYIIEKIQLKLAGWKQNLLSMAGRRVMIQSVTSSIPTYTMQTVLLPSSTCAAIDTLNRKFLWGSDLQSNKPHLVSWTDVCSPREHGGLGLRMARENNRALIAKLGWQLLQGKDKPWCKALTQKYLRSETFTNCSLSPSSSATWRSILKCRDVLRLGVRWRVGSGQHIKLWQDIWVGDKILLDHASNSVPPYLLNSSVADIIDSNGNWQLDQIGEFLPAHVLHLIHAVPLSTVGSIEDNIYWHNSTTGEFTVSSAFKLIQQQKLHAAQSEEDWLWIWKLCCSEKIKTFVWLLKRGRVLTNSVRFDRHLAPTPTCPRCEQSPETPTHLLRDCYYSRMVWDSMAPLPPDFFTLSFDNWLKKNSRRCRTSSALQENWFCLFLATIWNIWKSRNKLVFDELKIPPQAVSRQSQLLAIEMKLALGASVVSFSKDPRWVRWIPPQQPFLKLNTDGSRNHTTGGAAAGGLIRNHCGIWIHGFAVNVGVSSSFLAELWGCREGLKLAHSLGVQHLILEMDSLVAVQFIQSRKIAAGPASVLLADIFLLLDAFTSCNVLHTLREGNFAADFMASIGHDLPIGTAFYPSPPLGIDLILQDDCMGTMFLRN
ncbi:hypothetical protein SLA2020_049290 [Shorea laevis]